MCHDMQTSRVPPMPYCALNASEKKSAVKARPPQTNAGTNLAEERSFFCGVVRTSAVSVGFLATCEHAFVDGADIPGPARWRNGCETRCQMDLWKLNAAVEYVTWRRKI